MTGFNSPDEQVAWANKAMRALDENSPEGTGLVLLVFPLSQAGVTTYIANGQKADVARLLRETLDRFEADQKEKEENSDG